MGVVTAFLIIFLSRVLFLSISPSFFDSLGYLRLFNLPSLGEALRQAHYPIHPLWIAAGWTFNKIPISAALFKIEFLNAVLGTLSCFFIYKIARERTDKKRAILITLICAFTPYFWLSQTNVLYEPLLGVFLLGSFCFLLKRRIFWSGIFFAGAVWVSSTALIYLIFLAGFLERKGLEIFGVGILVGILGYLGILSLSGIPAGEIFAVLSAENSILEKIKLEGLMFFVRGIRNSLVVYFNYLTIPVGILLSYLSILSLLRKKTGGLIFCWLISFFLLNTVWHAGMFGRLSLLLTAVPVFLLGKLPEKFLKIILVFLIVYSSLKVVPYHFQKTPYILEKEYLEQISGEVLLIMSNYEEPYLRERTAEHRVLNSPNTDLKEIKGWLKKKLKEGKTVLMTSQAITAPYLQYDGMDYQILSIKKNFKQTDGQDILENYSKEIVNDWPKFNLKIYQLILPSQYCLNNL